MPLASIDAGDLCKVWEMRTLGKVRDADARSLLEKISKQVQPIMRKRKWRVMLLSEFWPGNPALLGLNVGAGQEVRIRLRQPGRESEFLPYEALLGTMLHELTHNEHGPHDSKFYALLDEITKECEDLMAKGISGTGQGFDAPGNRLGGYSHNPPMSSLRQAALAAAEKRARAGSLMPAGPRRLGGDSVIMKALSPVQAAAMAAERRLRDDLWCAAPDTLGEDGLQKAQERENMKGQVSPLDKNVLNVNEVGSSRNVKVGSILGPSDAKDALRVSSGGAVQVGDSSKSKAPQGPFRIADDREEGQLMEESSTSTFMWECSACTLLNPPLAIVCGACTTMKPERRMGKEAKNWSCKYCTLENSMLVDNCAACNQWRYSYGAPASTRASYVGT